MPPRDLLLDALPHPIWKWISSYIMLLVAKCAHIHSPYHRLLWHKGLQEEVEDFRIDSTVLCEGAHRFRERIAARGNVLLCIIARKRFVRNRSARYQPPPLNQTAISIGVTGRQVVRRNDVWMETGESLLPARQWSDCGLDRWHLLQQHHAHVRCRKPHPTNINTQAQRTAVCSPSASTTRPAGRPADPAGPAASRQGPAAARPRLARRRHTTTTGGLRTTLGSLFQPKSAQVRYHCAVSPWTIVGR